MHGLLNQCMLLCSFNIICGMHNLSVLAQLVWCTKQLPRYLLYFLRSDICNWRPYEFLPCKYNDSETHHPNCIPIYCSPKFPWRPKRHIRISKLFTFGDSRNWFIRPLFIISIGTTVIWIDRNTWRYRQVWSCPNQWYDCWLIQFYFQYGQFTGTIDCGNFEW